MDCRHLWRLPDLRSIVGLADVASARPSLVVIYAVSIAILARYDITRQSHAANIAKLRRARDPEEEPAAVIAGACDG